MPDLDEEFMIGIDEDTSIIPMLLEQKCLYFTSDHKFKLGKEYDEKLISIDFSRTIKDLSDFYEMKKSMDVISNTSVIPNMRVIFCTNCKVKSVFNMAKHTCHLCEKQNLNYSDEGDFIFQEQENN